MLAAALCYQRPAECCVAARADNLDKLKDPWRSELAALVSATRDASQPWGCPAAHLTLDVETDDAVLRVRRDGAAPMARRITHPGDLVSLGKAMLARPLPPQARLEPTELPYLPALDATPDASHLDEPPRAFVQGAADVRYAGVSELVSAGALLRGELPIDRWAASVGVRYGELVGDLGARHLDLGYSELAVMGGVGYAVVDEPRLIVGLKGGLAVVDMEVQTDPSSDNEVESGAVDGRLGAELRLSIPVWSVLRLHIAADAELSPASVASERRIEPELPPMPAYTIGLGLGVEVAVP